MAFKPGDKSTWGRGGSGSLLTFKSDFDSGHTIFVAGSGGFKTTSTVVPTAYEGSMVVLDPSAEVGGMVASQRGKIGRKVVFLDPTRANGKVDGFDVLAPVKAPENGAGKVIGVPNFAGIAAFAQMLMPEAAKADAGSAEFFKAQAHNLLTGMLVFVLWSGKYAPRVQKSRADA